MKMRSFQGSPPQVEPGAFDGAMEGARRATGVAPSIGRTEDPQIMSPPDPEVPEKKLRRKFTAKYKLHILAEAEACRETGQIGALLRREGLYSSYLNTWRRQKENGTLQALSPKRRGRKAKEKKQRELKEKQRLEAEKKRKVEDERKRRAEEKAEFERALLEEERREEEARKQAERAARLLTQRQQYGLRIKQAVEHNWLRPATNIEGFSCDVIIRQTMTGDVIDVQLKSCTNDNALQRSVERAVRKASPLPLPPNPDVFDREIQFTFKP